MGLDTLSEVKVSWKRQEDTRINNSAHANVEESRRGTGYAWGSRYTAAARSTELVSAKSFVKRNANLPVVGRRCLVISGDPTFLCRIAEIGRHCLHLSGQRCAHGNLGDASCPTERSISQRKGHRPFSPQHKLGDKRKIYQCLQHIVGNRSWSPLLGVGNWFATI